MCNALQKVLPSVVLLTGSGLEDGVIHYKQNTTGEWSEKALKHLLRTLETTICLNVENKACVTGIMKSNIPKTCITCPTMWILLISLKMMSHVHLLGSL